MSADEHLIWKAGSKEGIYHRLIRYWEQERYEIDESEFIL